MCEPVTIATAVVGVVSAAMSYQQSNKMADAQYASQTAAIQQQSEITNANLRNQYLQQQLRISQEASAASVEKQQNTVEYVKARATALTSAGESNVGGISVDALLADYGRQHLNQNSTVDRNYGWTRDQLQMDMKSFYANAQNTLASVDRSPSMGQSAGQFGVNLAGAGLQAAQTYQTMTSLKPGGLNPTSTSPVTRRTPELYKLGR